MPLARVLALIGGLALAGAYFMPWFGVQNVLLTGAVLGQILSGTTDLRRLMPGAAGGEAEVLALRALVAFFPACGVAGVVLAMASAARPARRGALDLALDSALVAIGLIALTALVVGVTRLPPGSTLDAGVWAMAVGAIGLVAGGLLDGVGRVSRAGRADAPSPRRGGQA